MNFGLFSNTTCGLNCWLAEEDVCRCYCSGVNHGLLLKEGATQPIRMAKIQGVFYNLSAVVDYFNHEGRREIFNKNNELNRSEIRKTSGEYTYRYAQSDVNSPAKIKVASKQQAERWGEIRVVMKEGKVRPYLFWIRTDIFSKIKGEISEITTESENCPKNCPHLKTRFLSCEEHKGDCQEVVCCDCGESMPDNVVPDYKV